MIDIEVFSTFLETQGTTQLIAIGSLFVSFFSLYYARKAYLSNKTKAITEKKQERYDLLNVNIFVPLYESLITVTTQNDSLPFIRIGEYSHFDHIEEGLQHLEKDVKKFSERVDKLRKDTDEYNKGHDSFRNNELISMVQKFLKNNNYTLDVDSSTTESNTIILSNLLDLLKAFWYSNTTYDVRPQGNRLLAPMKGGLALIATVSDGNFSNVMESIFHLREYVPIVKRIQYYREMTIRITTEADNVKKDIKTNIIDKISKKEYTTKCNSCKKIK